MIPWLEYAGAALYCGDSTEVLRTLPDNSVQCCVTSPPYFGLRDYGDDGQLGQEPTPEIYVANLVDLFREVRRVLREDGTLWLNIGDSYANDGKWGGSSGGKHAAALHGNTGIGRGKKQTGLKPKNLIGIPWMLAFALRSDGWYLRSEIIWSKRSPMTESVRDRPTKAHEQIFLLTKSPRYFYDLVGSQEQAVTGNRGSRFDTGKTRDHGYARTQKGDREDKATRNMRSVWSLSTYPLKAKHFAAFPPELVRRCLSAGISEKGCCSVCGKPWFRQTEKRRIPTRSGKDSKVNRASQHEDSPYELMSGSVVGNRDPKRHVTETVTVGWKAACECVAGDPVPCSVLDCFHGAGTTWKVCERLGASYIGIDLNEEYLQLSVDRPAVVFPHERKQKKARERRVNESQLLLPLS